MPDVLELRQTQLGGPDDVHRSLRRYVALMLGSPPWTVRLQRVAVADDERPVAVLDPGPLTTPVSRAGTRTAGDEQKMQTFTVVAYPALGATANESGEIARQVAALLDAGFARGLVTDDTPPREIGAPWRVPVWSYADVPIEGANRAGPADPYMHANVSSSFSVRPIQDSLDELRYTVAATVGLTYWLGGRAHLPTPIVRQMPGTARVRG